MLLIYGDYTLSYSISSSGPNDAVFLTDPTTMNNGRSGDGCSLRWVSGAQTTASFVQVTVGITGSPFGESSPAIGGCGLINVQGLPLGTKVQIGSVVQRLVEGPRGEPCAWALPFTNGTSIPFKVFNDVNGVASIPASTVFAWGETLVGRAIYLPELVNTNNMAMQPTDTTGYQRSSGNQLHQFMRKPYWSETSPLGWFTAKQAKGGALSDLPNGGNPAGVIDMKRLIMLLATSQGFAVCDTPSAGRGTGTVTNGIRYDQDFMQSNWLMVKPIDMSQLVQSKPPYWSWTPRWQEAL